MRLGVLAAFVAVVDLSGCASTLRCGDARVTRPKDDFFLNLTALGLITDGYAVKLPTVALAKKGTTVFHVDSLPTGTYEYRFYLTGGLTNGRPHMDHDASPSDSSAQTAVSFRATSQDGRRLFGSDVQLGKLRWSNFGRAMYPVIHFPTSNATSFALAITIQHPSSAPHETLHVDAFSAAP